MQQKIEAGKTPVGAGVQAKLVIATLMNGTVIPRDAVFSGVVTESAAKTETAPSRLALRMDSAKWKNGSLPVKIYLTSWYYPLKIEMRDPASLPEGIHGEAQITFGGVAPPSPPGTADGPRLGEDPTAVYPSTTPASTLSSYRIPIEGITSVVKNNDGSLVITSTRHNIKLDKSTTYVLATSELAAKINPVVPSKK